MYLIAGLGNPEKKYDGTRHNIGFCAAKMLAEQYRISLNKSKFQAIYGDGIIGGEKVIIALPQTYMNLSGDSIREISSFYKILPQNIIVLHDDISLDTGKIRIRPKGSAGGHNGLKSIIANLGNDVFCRIKIGVGAPNHPGYDLADYVLGKFTKEDMQLLQSALERTMQAVECIITKGSGEAMNSFNGN